MPSPFPQISPTDRAGAWGGGGQGGVVVGGGAPGKSTMKGAFTQVIQGAGGLGSPAPSTWLWIWIQFPTHSGLYSFSGPESYNCKYWKLKAFTVLSLLWCLLMVSLTGCLTKMSGAQTSLDLREAPKAKIARGQRPQRRGPEEGREGLARTEGLGGRGGSQGGG